MKVKDLMVTRLITIDARKSIGHALVLMQEHNIRRLPVVEGKKLLGIIVQHDIEIAIRRPEVILETPVDWIMTKYPITTSPETDLTDVIDLMVANKISALPVLAEGKLVGLISEIDILKLIGKMLRSP